MKERFKKDIYHKEETIEETPVEEVEADVIADEVIEEPIKEETTKKVTVNATKLNVRSSASADARIMKVVDKGTVLEGTFEDDWFAIKDGGYVMSKFVD